MHLEIKIYMLINALCAAAGTLLIRYGGKNLDLTRGIWYIFRHGYLWIIGMLISWIAGLLFSILLTKFEITTAFTLYVPLVYLFIILGGVFLFNEAFSLSKIVGMFFIFIGLIFLFKNT